MNNKNLISKLSFFVFFLSVSFLFSNSVYAATCHCVGTDATITITSCGENNANCGTECTKLQKSPGLYEESADPTKTVPVSADPTKVPAQTLPNPLGITDINAFIAQLINFV